MPNILVSTTLDHGLRTPKQIFFSKISNFCVWADILGWIFFRHLGYFRPDSQQPFWYCEFLVHICHYSTIISTKNEAFISNSQIFIWEWIWAASNFCVPVVCALDLLLSLHCGCAQLREFVSVSVHLTMQIHSIFSEKVSFTKLINELSTFGCLSLKFHNQLCFNKHNMATWLDNTSRDTFLW